ncbi:hypothetical protein O6H91_23G041500 [Diphasiastrum complanatum]|uniref:Uncharacterized protein n=1 Tax=Diphasiastrum complanatum TaxID=34168 RepID=A0ACC2AAA3_DIPCM|nr:hypothetical protein O6H91_23G041500 [Diphasiastrum complanatum]
MLFLMEYLCPPGGTVLDLGCETSAVMKVARHSHRPCLSLDCDDVLVREYLMPLKDAGKGKLDMPLVGKDNTLGEEVQTFSVTLDWSLLVYAESITRIPEEDPDFEEFPRVRTKIRR